MALHFSRALLLIIATLVCACSYAAANTCIKHFSPTAEHKSPDGHTLDLITTLTPGGFSVLTAPYTLAPIATISTQQSTNASRADKEQWYRLDNLQLGVSYELRISNAAATGVDFDIELYSADDILRLHNKPIDNTELPPGVGGYLAIYAKVTALYGGYSTWPDVRDWPVTYAIALEKHVAGLPVQALKLIGVLVSVVLVGLFVVTPRLIATINAVVAEEHPEFKSKLE
ncbi:hypothetical protein FBU31_003997 [Coemansia sp. 'formosensis']|nr:hypothetical protein FBU31_003997 [Coemansia sp. 'formosensis']